MLSTIWVLLYLDHQVEYFADFPLHSRLLCYEHTEGTGQEDRS